MSSSDTEMEDTTESQSKKGRPKGTTIKKIHNEKIRFINATNYVAQTFYAMKSECDGKQGRPHKVPRGTLANIINDATQKFNVPKSYKIKERTIRSRVNRNHLHANQRGKASPMANIEDVLL